MSVTMRDAAAPTMLSVAAEQLSSARTVLPGRWPSSSTPMVVASELRPSGSPAALAELRHARGGGGGRAQTAWVPATLAELWHARGDGQAPPAQLQSLATGAELRPAQLPAAATMLNPPRVPPQLMGSSPGPRAGVADGGDEGENAREKNRKRGTYRWAKGKNCLFHPHLTAHGWEFGRNGIERINQNFYGTEGNLKNFIAYKEPI